MADKSQAIAPGWIPLWTYRRAFSVNGTRYDVVATMYALSLLSRVYRDGSLVDEQQLYFAFGYHNLLHELPLSGEDSLRIELGFFNWVNVGIRASTTDGWVYESHPDKDIGFMQDHPLMAAAGSSDADAQRKQKERWNRNKPSIYADISLGLLFFAVGKLTGDLVQAALIGAAAGLALVVAQRFVKVDLLGGFAVFGTIMLLISAGFSLAFQSEFMVQMKSTVLGLLTAALFFGDGLFRRGGYFGARMQRYIPIEFDTARMAMGLGMLGVTMAGLNYVVATVFSEDAWLIYSTFLDMPLSIALAYAVFFWARAGNLSHRH